MKRFFQIGLMMVLLFTLTACGPFFQKSTGAANDFLDALQEDTASAYALVSNEFKAEIPQAQFDEFMSLNPNLMAIESRKFNSWDVSSSQEGGQATIAGELTFEDGTTSPIQFVLVKEEGEWRVLNLDLAPQPAELEPATDEELEEAPVEEEPLEELEPEEEAV